MAPRLGLKRVTVEGLLGSYDYDLDFSKESIDSGLAIIYGENGTGKTKLLSLLFHVLSPAPYAAHRLATSQIPFRKISIEITDGGLAIAEKKDPADASYAQTVCLSTGETLTVDPMPIKKPAPTVGPDPYLMFCGLLRQLGVRPKLLSHQRILSQDGEGSSRNIGEHETILGPNGAVIPMDTALDFARADTDVLMRMIDLATRALSREASSLRDSGMVRADRMYANLVTQLATQSELIPLHSVIEGLHRLLERNKDFNAFGLSSKVQFDRTISQLQLLNPSSPQASFVGSVLKPYVADLNSRLDALESLNKMLTSVLKTMNEMLLNKRVTFSIQDGFQVNNRNDGFIPPNHLSSGERQLLLLVCTALSSRSGNVLLLVDEPELSLNITWQRALIPLLQTCLGKRSSMVAATHSIEILAPFREMLLRLPPQNLQIQQLNEVSEAEPPVDADA